MPEDVPQIHEAVGDDGRSVRAGRIAKPFDQPPDVAKLPPVADQRTAHQAPTLELAPDPAHRRVVAAVHDVDLTDPIRHVVALVDLDRLDEAAVRTLATKLIDIVFLQRSRVLDRPEGADPEDWAPERGGVVPTRGESADWLG